MLNLLQSMQWGELIRSKTFPAGLGLFSFLLFNNGEWDHHSHVIVISWMSTFAALTAGELFFDPRSSSIFEALLLSLTAAAWYFTTLVASILVYRAFFHRLRKFPGPFLCRLSKWYSVIRISAKFQLYKDVEAMHQHYQSDIIRTGPRELSVASADAIALLYGPMSKCQKGPWYDASTHVEGSSLHTTRSKQNHKERRKIWDRAFSAKSLREYEPRLNRHGLALMERLKEHAHEPSVRISNWANFYSFDVMGDLGFSRSFGMVEKGEEDDQIKALHSSMAPMSVFQHMPWLANLLLHTHVGQKALTSFMAWGSRVLRERKQVTPVENDVFGYLLDPNVEDIPLDLNADSRLLIVAGSDTTAATLTWLFYELCKNPEVQARIQNIVDDIYPEKSFLDCEDLANLPYLDGVIQEALRLHPAVPSGMQRETPPEGLTLPDQTYIPGETIIWMPVHTIQRDPRYYRSPLKFMPERWTDEASDYVIDKRAFITFGTGIYSCIGQKVAFQEMRSVVANLMRNFEMRFADGEDGSSCEQDTRDCFTLNVGKLDVKLTPRYKV